ncbi:TPA: PerC family transcriptional regulator [Salmonella enterica subsp. diarizonae serovar 50:k:z35]
MTVLSYAARNNQAGACVCTSEGVIVLLWSKLPGMAAGMVVMILDEKAEKPELAGLYRRAAARWLTVAGARILNHTAEKDGTPAA